MKPFIVFKRAKRDVHEIAKELRNKCIIASSCNGWMNNDLTHNYVNSVHGSLSFKRRLLAWDTYECLLVVSSLFHSLRSKKIDVAVVPGGCARYIQTPDVCAGTTLLKPIAQISMTSGRHLMESVRRLTGNLSPPPR